MVDSKSAEKQYCGDNYSESDRIQYGYQYHDDQGYFRYVGIPKVLNVSDEDYEEICKICPPESIVEKNIEVEKREKELLDKVDSIRRMIKFFVILTIICLVSSLLVILIELFSM